MGGFLRRVGGGVGCGGGGWERRLEGWRGLERRWVVISLAKPPRWMEINEKHIPHPPACSWCAMLSLSLAFPHTPPIAHPQKNKKKTHHLQPPAAQDSLRRRRNTPAIALQIPHDFPAPDLREHGADLLDVGGIGAAAVGRRRARRGGGREEEIADGQEDEDED